VVVLIGSLSQHLEPTDPRVPVIVQRLLDTLKVPSEHVQMAVAECLPPLVKTLKEDSAELVQTMLTRLVDGKSEGERKGAVCFWILLLLFSFSTTSPTDISNEKKKKKN